MGPEPRGVAFEGVPTLGSPLRAFESHDALLGGGGAAPTDCDCASNWLRFGIWAGKAGLNGSGVGAADPAAGGLLKLARSCARLVGGAAAGAGAGTGMAGAGTGVDIAEGPGNGGGYNGAAFGVDGACGGVDKRAIKSARLGVAGAGAGAGDGFVTAGAPGRKFASICARFMGGAVAGC
jgi:hypothetical protein